MASVDNQLVDDDFEPEGQSDTTGEADTEEGDPLEGREDLQKALYRLYLKCCSEDRFPRMMEVKDWQQACMYWRGLQYWWWSQRDEAWNLPNQQHGLQIVPQDVDDMPRFEFVTNIYQAFGLSLIAAIAQAPPRTRFFPEDADIPADVETAEGYTKLAKIIERWNPIQVQLQDEVYNLWTGGVVAGWIRFVADGEKYGFEATEDIDSETQEGEPELHCSNCGYSAMGDEAQDLVGNPCPQCGEPLTEDDMAQGADTNIPTSSGESQVPNGREVITIVGAGNLKRPQYCREQSEFHYLAFEEEIHYAKLRAAYPDIADKIKRGAGSGEDNLFERTARLSVLQGTHLQMQTGEAASVLNTFARVWFRPDSFWSDGITKSEREELLDIFPTGCRVYFAGPEYCESKEESMDKCWVVQHAMPGDGQHRPGIGTSLLSVQDRFNTFSNIAAETYEYGIPITYRAANTWDAEASEEQRSEPGAEVDVKIADNVDIRTRIMQLRNDSASPDMMSHMMELMGPVAQELTGVFPALQGGAGGEGAAGDTASGYAMQRDQALGRCGISYVRMKQFHADIQTLACKDFCENSGSNAKMSVLGKSGDFESESIDVTALEGDAKAYPEGDENYPVLWPQQREAFFQILGMPMGAQLLTDADNADLAIKLAGIPGLKLPGSDAKRKALRIIGELTDIPEAGEGEMPEGDPEDQVQMSPDLSQQAASLVEQDVDDYASITQAVLDWMNGDDGQKCKKVNPAGYMNVKAYMLAEKALIPKAQPPTKPLAETFTTNFKDLPPEAQAQALEQMGIHVTPEDFIAAVALAKAKNSKPTLGQAQAGPPANPGVTG